MSTIEISQSFVEEVRALLDERAQVIVEISHGVILAGVSGNLVNKAVYDPNGADIHAKREMLTRFWDAVRFANLGLKLRFDLTRELGCLVIDAPSEEQIAALRTLEV